MPIRTINKELTPIVDKLCEQHRDKPMRWIARKIVAEYPEHFTQDTEEKKIENARAMVRHRFGAKGEKHLKYKKFDKINLPEEDKTDEWQPYRMPDIYKRILLLSDIHAPFHDTQALNRALQHGQEFEADAILLNGDILDCYWVSRHDKNPNRIKRYGFQYEIDVGFALLQAIRDAFPEAHIVFKEGNHEQRTVHYLQKKAPELAGVDAITLPELLKLRELNIDWVDDCKPIYVGDLPVLHGHEFGNSTFSPVNPARGYAIRANETMIAGHNHQTSEHSQKRKIKGEFYTTWSTGCLCHLRPGYTRFNNWNHGFATIELENKLFKVKNYRISDGEIL